VESPEIVTPPDEGLRTIFDVAVSWRLLLELMVIDPNWTGADT
jgi:hypothetical protein